MLITIPCLIAIWFSYKQWGWRGAVAAVFFWFFVEQGKMTLAYLGIIGSSLGMVGRNWAIARVSLSKALSSFAYGVMWALTDGWYVIVPLTLFWFLRWTFRARLIALWEEFEMRVESADEVAQ